MKNSVFGLVALLLVGTPGCQGSSAFARNQEILHQLKDGQDAILARLDALEANVGKGARPAPRPKPDTGPKPGRPDPSAVYKATVDDAHVKGPDSALVTIVEWSDFQCPFCKRVVPTIEEIHEEYGDKVRVAFKNNPLPMHNRALPGALAAEAAGKQGKFWEMHNILFEHGRELTDENFAKWAEELGLDVERFKKDMADKALEAKVKKQQQQGAQLGARGTPAFFVNGRFLSGAQPFEAFKTLIDEELAKAEKIARSGVPANKVYDKVMSSAKAGV